MPSARHRPGAARRKEEGRGQRQRDQHQAGDLGQHAGGQGQAEPEAVPRARIAHDRDRGQEREGRGRRKVHVAQGHAVVEQRERAREVEDGRGQPRLVVEEPAPDPPRRPQAHCPDEDGREAAGPERIAGTRDGDGRDQRLERLAVPQRPVERQVLAHALRPEQVQRLVDEDGQAGQPVRADGHERQQQRGEGGEDRGAAHRHGQSGSKRIRAPAVWARNVFTPRPS